MSRRLPGIPAAFLVAFALPLAALAGTGVPLGISIPFEKATRADFARFTKNTDIVPRLVEIPADLPDEPSPISLPVERIQAIRAIDAIPVLAWMIPASIGDETWNAHLRELAEKVRDDGGEIWMRPAMSRGDAPPDAGLYRRAFRRIVEIFREENAGNVRWLFVADITRHEGPEAALGTNAFPGADVVDLVGMRGLNWGTTRTSAIHGWDSEWRSFREIFEESCSNWETLAAGKPIIAIAATVSIGGRKSNWVPDAVRTAAEWKLAALVWFQQAGQIDWAIQESIPREVMMEAQTRNEPLAK